MSVLDILTGDSLEVDQNRDDSQLNRQAADFFKNFPEVVRNARIGIIHNIPISTTMKIFKYFSLNPSFNYTEAWYPQRLNYTYIPQLEAVSVDTIRRFSRVYAYSAAAGLTTRIYGTFNFKKGARLQAIRHTIVPTVSFGYSPDLSGDRVGFFQDLQLNEEGQRQRVSRYLGFDPAAPAGRGAQGWSAFLCKIFLRPRYEAGVIQPRPGR
ncbi:MAG: hypothetical protein HC880_09325 [Bacteroidia bacterium]|nr:hypothetical protein [Bacteroidia bacterium]